MDKRGNPSFVKGNKLGPGRPKGSKNKLTLDLQKAIREVEKEKDKSLFKHFVERAYRNDAVLVALVKKLLPDKTQADLDLRGDLSITVISAIPEHKNAD